MAAAVVEKTSSADFERQTKSPSPLSFWTKVSPDIVTSPTRTVFTIVDDNAENSPRPPKPELSKLEARGMVSLSSQWTQDEERSTIMNTSNGPKNTNHQKPVKRVNFSQFCDNEQKIIRSSSRTEREIEDCDDDLVIVTDKNTQTEQPWPYLSTPSSNTHQRNKTEQRIGSAGNCENNINSQSGQNEVDNNTSNNSDIPNECMNQDDTTASEAPTLKVEYVGKVWDAYINDFLLASDHIAQAAIYDKASKSCIACSLQFAMSQDEFDHILTSINCLAVAYRQGISINHRHYKTVLADGRRGLMAKGEENDGCSVCQTRTLVLVAMHDRRSKGRRCNDELMRLGDFFWAKGL